VDILQGGELVHQEIVVFGHVGQGDLDQEIKLAGQVIGFHDFGEFHDLTLEGFQDGLRMFFKLDVDEGGQAFADEVLVQQGHVFFDDALGLEALDPFINGRDRLADLVGDFLIVQAGIVLQQLQDSDIVSVEQHFFRKDRGFDCSFRKKIQDLTTI